MNLIKSNIYIQYSIVFSLSLLIINIINPLNFIVSNFGKLLVISLLSWIITHFLSLRSNYLQLISPSGKAVLITGCDTGFGHSLALRLNKLGYRVFATVFDPTNSGSQLLKQNALYSDKIYVIKMDVTNDEEVMTAHKEVVSHLNKSGDNLWAVVNNAGISCLGHTEWGTMDNYKSVFEVNVFGLVRVTRVFLPLIRKSRGRIVNMASIAGRITSDNIGIYSMSKHAVISFSDALRREMSKWGVKVATIEPAYFQTYITSAEFSKNSFLKTWNETEENVKKAYGQQYFESQFLVNKNTAKAVKRSVNLDLVIRDITDAIINLEPKITYRPIDGLISRIIIMILFFIPNKMIDQIICSRNKTMPDLNNN